MEANFFPLMLPACDWGVILTIKNLFCSVLFPGFSFQHIYVPILFNSVKVTELPPDWEAANSAYHL